MWSDHESAEIKSNIAFEVKRPSIRAVSSEDVYGKKIERCEARDRIEREKSKPSVI